MRAPETTVRCAHPRCYTEVREDRFSCYEHWLSLPFRIRAQLLAGTEHAAALAVGWWVERLPDADPLKPRRPA